jgi:hypothetical protein
MHRKVDYLCARVIELNSGENVRFLIKMADNRFSDFPHMEK